ncbi:potassium channel family protein [Symmachiella dynata]|uniref:Ion channel n=1 Tax=Symmachiella dynata TaxID=2527995 RepID=A0A517ZQ49_9PLAN|nr:potassium channel family protein [Symmachiella dynata]QDT48956.1 Ion channel [Symmachiella dynata]QDU44615.1 Ion channel [Symmachiella dynata]|tara:strand:+ start:248 stop:625 length:378 start_codon:yes stop_codon:yes gene_type:complete
MANKNPKGVTSYKSFLTFVFHLVHYCHILRGILNALFFLVFSGGLAFAQCEGIPFSQGIYFSLITSTTVGFGDITPKTGIGQCISVFLAFIGTLYFGLIVSVATRAFTETIKEYLHAQGKAEFNA